MTTLLDMNEPVVDALVARLTTDLPAVIAALNAEAGVGTTKPALDDFQQILDYPPSPARLTVFPTIGIQDDVGGFEDDTGFAATGRYTQGIIVHHAHPDQDILARQMRRYVRAVASVALNTRGLGNDAWGVVLKRIAPGPTLEVEEDPRTWQTWAGVIIEVRTDEG